MWKLQDHTKTNEELSNALKERFKLTTHTQHSIEIKIHAE